MKSYTITLLALIIYTLPTAAQTASEQSAIDQLTKVCQQKARHTPAFVYCMDFVEYNLHPDQSGLGDRFAKFTNLQSLAAAYAFERAGESLQTISSDLADKAAASAKSASANILQQDVSSPSTDTGSTSLVLKSAATQLLAIGVESGALTENQVGNTVTIKGNVDHIFHELVLQDAEISYLPHGTPVLQNFTVSASLGINSNSTTSAASAGSATSQPVDTSTVNFTTSVTKLSSIGINYDFRNKLTQSHIKKLAINSVYKILTSDQKALLGAESTFGTDLQPLAGVCTLNDFKDALKPVAKLTSKGPDGTTEVVDVSKVNTVTSDDFQDFVATFNKCFDNGINKLSDAQKAQADTDTAAYMTALANDISDYQTGLAEQLRGWDITAQYVFNKPVGQPETHDFRLIGSGSFEKQGDALNNQKPTWTLNAAASIYQTLPAGAKYGRLKDAQIAGEMDWMLGTKATSPSFSVAGYGQYQDSPSVLNVTATDVPSDITLPANAQVFISGTDGWLGVVQAKVIVHLGGAQIPLAMKWSNKTNLLDKNKLGAQFGISYDLSSLKQLIGGGSN